MKLDDHERKEINNAYNQKKKTPEDFEATPVITFVIIISIISVIWFIPLVALTYYIRK